MNNILKTKKEFNYKVYAYCLMDNHVHMVIKIEKDFLSKVMKSLMIRYVQYFNRKYERKGTLVQNRFKSKNVESQRYFLEVCRYVHRNPENAGMVKTEKYKWSSYQEYLGEEKIIDKDFLMNYFNNDIKEFINYTAKGLCCEDFNEFAEYEIMGRLTDTQLEYIITKIFNVKNVNQIPLYFKNQSKEELDGSIAKLKKIKGTSKNQLSRVTRISRYKIAHH